MDLKAPIEIAFIDQFGQEEYVVFFLPFIFSAFGFLISDSLFPRAVEWAKVLRAGRRLEEAGGSGPDAV